MLKQRWVNQRAKRAPEFFDGSRISTPSGKWSARGFTAAVRSFTPNFSRDRKSLDARLRQSFFFSLLPGRRMIYARRVHSFTFTVHRRFIARRISYVAPADFPPRGEIYRRTFARNRCTGCPDSTARARIFFPGRRSRPFRDPVSAYGTRDVSNSSLYQRCCHVTDWLSPIPTRDLPVRLSESR